MQHFGPTILNSFFKPYTRKVWTVDTSKMSPNWVGTRVAKLPQEKLESLCAMNRDELAVSFLVFSPFFVKALKNIVCAFKMPSLWVVCKYCQCTKSFLES